MAKHEVVVGADIGKLEHGCRVLLIVGALVLEVVALMLFLRGR